MSFVPLLLLALVALVMYMLIFRSTAAGAVPNHGHTALTKLDPDGAARAWILGLFIVLLSAARRSIDPIVAPVAAFARRTTAALSAPMVALVATVSPQSMMAKRHALTRARRGLDLGKYLAPASQRMSANAAT